MPPLRVLVVDDSVVVRKMITEALRQDPGLELAGIAANGVIALQKLAQVNPDVVTLDIEMPEMDGVATIKALRKTHPKLPVIMCSSLTTAGAEATLDALAAGANDYVTKPAQSTSVVEGIERLALELLPRIHALCGTRGRAVVPVAPVAPRRPVATSQPSRPPADVLCIASSTGGPNALADVFGAMRESLGVPIVIVQHMPPLFTQTLADRLGKRGPHPFHEAADGQELLAGHAYIAPGGRHLEVKRVGTRVVAKLHDGPPENSCRPAADVLIRSVAQTYGAGTVACVLTGMGQDGMRGCELVRELGGFVVAQDEATSVVWGMPGAVVNAGLAHVVRPLSEIADVLTQQVGAGRRLRATA